MRGPEGWWGMALERRAMLGVKESKAWWLFRNGVFGQVHWLITL